MKKTNKQQSPVDHGRGNINHNALEALVTSVIFRCKVEKPKKGKGAYSRKQNRQGHLQGAPDAFWVLKFLTQSEVPYFMVV